MLKELAEHLREAADWHECEAEYLRRMADLVDGDPAAEPEPAAEVWLTPGQIAERIGVGERYVTKLLARGLSVGHPGVRKPAGRWAATMAAVRDLRAV